MNGAGCLRGTEEHCVEAVCLLTLHISKDFAILGTSFLTVLGVCARKPTEECTTGTVDEYWRFEAQFSTGIDISCVNAYNTSISVGNFDLQHILVL